MIKAYEEKMTYLLRHQDNACGICGRQMDARQYIDLHHAHIHNKGWIRRRYPLFVDSIFNLQAAHSSCNTNTGSGHWPEPKVRWYEIRMARDPILADWANSLVTL